MNTIEVGNPTLENIDTAMATMGFVKTSESTSSKSYYRWGNDTEGKALLTYDGATLSYEWQTTQGGVIRDLYANTKICYEPLARGGIAFDFIINSSDTTITCAYVAPKASGDDWAFIPRNVDYASVCDYSTNQKTSYPISQIYDGPGEYSNNVQIHKIYNGARFMNNVNRTLLQPQLPWGGNVRAMIGTTEYLLFRCSNQVYNLWAVELP